MRKRRSRSHVIDDGLDLMLDTIANLFGGIVLIALLIAVMTSEQTHAIVVGGGEEGVYEVLNAESAVDVVRRQITEADFELARSIRDAMTTADDARTQASLESIVSRLESERQANLRALSERRGVLETLRQRDRENGDLASNLDRDIQELQGVVQLRKQELQTGEEIRRPPLVLPKGGVTDAQPVVIVMRFGRLFVPFDIRSHQAEPSSRYIDREDGWIEFVADSEGGVPVAQDFAGSTRWHELKSMFPSQTCFYQVGVYSDSYEAYLYLRSAMNVEDYQYQLYLFGEEDSVFIGPDARESRPVDSVPMP